MARRATRQILIRVASGSRGVSRYFFSADLLRHLQMLLQHRQSLSARARLQGGILSGLGFLTELGDVLAVVLHHVARIGQIECRPFQPAEALPGPPEIYCQGSLGSVRFFLLSDLLQFLVRLTVIGHHFLREVLHLRWEFAFCSAS